MTREIVSNLEFMFRDDANITFKTRTTVRYSALGFFGFLIPEVERKP